MARTEHGFAYDIEGDGDWLLMINGIGAPRGAWAYQMKDLSARFRCITFDNRGVGDGGYPAGPYTTAMMADDAGRLLAELDVARAHVLGASMGGAIAQEFALRHPQRVERLAIVCSWAACDKYLERCFTVLRETAAIHGPQGRGWSAAVDRILSIIGFTVDDFVRTPAILDALAQTAAKVVAAGYEQEWEGFVAQADACLSHDTRGRIGEITAPTLILAGDEDRFTPLHLSRALADGIPNARLEIMERCGHVMFYERPAEFNRRVIDFLTGG